MKSIRLIVITTTLFFSCKSYTEKEIIGLYAPVNYNNTFDTIRLIEGGKYYRKVYDKNKTLVLKMEGKWNVHSDIIEFESPYFYNLDRDLIKYPELMEDTVSNGNGYVGLKNGTIEFCIGYFSADLPDQNCYQKIN